MMRLIVFIVFTCVCKQLQAQVNYVLNPSFELYSHCPTGLDQIKYANYWSAIDTVDNDALCTPEYCNTCATRNSGVSVPEGGFFHHYAHTGNGMAEVTTYVNEPSFPEYQRDYLQGRLYKPLIAGMTYCVTFYVSFELACKWANNNIGAYLDDGSIDAGRDSAHCSIAITTYTPQVYETTVINDSLNWTKVQGSFIANGSEKFITIANFFDNARTTVVSALSSGGSGGYYLVDDVSVIESNAVANAGPDVGVTRGDSVHIGTNEEGMPCTWYVVGDTTPIGYSGGIWVKPDSSTNYAVMMDLCGHVTYDTVHVGVWNVGVPFGKLTMTGMQVWPNPVRGELMVSFDKLAMTDARLTMTDMVGRVVMMMTIKNDQEVIDVSHLPRGIYIVQVVESETGVKVVRRVVKE